MTKNEYDYIDALISANIGLIRDHWLRSFPVSVQTHSFSVDFDQRIRCLIQEKPLFFTHRRILKIILIAVLILITIFTLYAYRRQSIIHDITVSKDGIVYLHTGTNTYDNSPLKQVVLDYVPYGFQPYLLSTDSIDGTWQNNEFEITYGRDMDNEYRFALFQLRIERQSEITHGISTGFSIDSLEIVEINGTEGYLFDDGGQIGLYWDIENYLLELDGTRVDKNELLKIAKNIRLQ